MSRGVDQHRNATSGSTGATTGATTEGMDVRVLPLGDRAVLVEAAEEDPAAVARVHRALDRDRAVGVVDLVPAARTVLVTFDPGLIGVAAVRAWVGEVAAAGPERESADGPDPEVLLPVHYEGEDLAEVAELTGLTVREVVAAHTGTPWAVAFTGFAPGFAYLVGGDPRLRTPRRATPRPQVRAGAVGLAGPYSGIYPRTSPGGWQLIGHTEVRLWDLAADPPATLRPGMRVRFVDAASDDHHRTTPTDQP